MYLLTSYRVNLETGVARNQGVSDGSVDVKVSVSGSYSTDLSSARQVLFNIELIGLLGEDRIIVVCIQNIHRNAGCCRSCRCAVVCSCHCQRVVIPRLAIQRLTQVDPSTVRKDAEDIVFNPVTATGRHNGCQRFVVIVLGVVCVSKKSVCEARVVTGV